MLIEAVNQPVRYRWPGGEICLLPGRPVDLSEDRARKLLAKVPEKVRVVGEVMFLCRGCGQWSSFLHNLGVGQWRCLECVERRALSPSCT